MMMAIQLTDMMVLQKTLHNEIIIQDMWIFFVPLFSVESNA